MRTSVWRRLASVPVVLASVVMANSPPVWAEPSTVWQPAAAPLMTPWTALVGPNNALPEYPRPQMQRTSWQNLNGVWNYLGRTGTPLLAAPGPESYPEQILVPYPPESALSGIARHDDDMWYRRTFQFNAPRQGQQVLVHFGAVDQIATVWVNGQQVARHEGGYTEFSADITAALRAVGPQEIVVRAQDRNEANPFPVGKQRNHPGGLFYTGSSGIWQTVWLEEVPVAHLEKLDVTTDLDAVTVIPKTAGATDERVVVFVSNPAGRVVAVNSGAPGEPIRIPVSEPQLWSPDHPNLYSMKVALVRTSGQVVDVVSSYAGLRTIGTVPDRQGRQRVALNGKVTFLHGP